MKTEPILKEIVVRTIRRRCERPLRAYFGTAVGTHAFFAWLSTVPLGVWLARGRTLRDAVKELLREHAGGACSRAEQAFDAAWRETALEAVRERFRAGRRIVPFIAYERVAAGEPAEEVAVRLGLRAEDVRGYVEEVERELRAERVE